MTLEEIEDLTSSTLSDSTPSAMTLSNISSSQQMSLSLHSEVSGVSQLSEAEKHEIEETVDSNNDDLAAGYDEMIESSSTQADSDGQSGVTAELIDEKFVIELKDTEKHVRFPHEDTTTDVLYSNDQLSQSYEGVINASEMSGSVSEDISKFAHCVVDEFSKGPLKEKTISEEKEAASLSSSVITTDADSAVTSDESTGIITSASQEQFLQEDEQEQEDEEHPSTPTNQIPSGAEGQQSEASESSSKFYKHVSFEEDNSPESQTGPSVDFSDFNIPKANGINATFHTVLSYTSSLEAQPPSEVYSLHSDEVELSPSSSTDVINEANTRGSVASLTSVTSLQSNITTQSSSVVIAEQVLVEPVEPAKSQSESTTQVAASQDSTTEHSSQTQSDEPEVSEGTLNHCLSFSHPLFAHEATFALISTILMFLSINS